MNIIMAESSDGYAYPIVTPEVHMRGIIARASPILVWSVIWRIISNSPRKTKMISFHLHYDSFRYTCTPVSSFFRYIKVDLPMLPLKMPCTPRDNTSRQKDAEDPKLSMERARPNGPSSKIGFLPTRSDNHPH